MTRHQARRLVTTALNAQRDLDDFARNYQGIPADMLRDVEYLRRRRDGRGWVVSPNNVRYLTCIACTSSAVARVLDGVFRKPVCATHRRIYSEQGYLIDALLPHQLSNKPT